MLTFAFAILIAVNQSVPLQPTDLGVELEKVKKASSARETKLYTEYGRRLEAAKTDADGNG